MKGTKTRSGEDKILYTGLSQALVVAICPSNDELRDLGKDIKEEKEEPEYIKDKDVDIKNAEGEVEKTITVKSARIDVWFNDAKNDVLFKKSFFLEDRDVISKSGKLQFINQSGNSFYSDSKGSLPSWFSNFEKSNGKGKEKTILGPKVVRVAKVGEADLMDFIVKWLCGKGKLADGTKYEGYDTFDQGTNLLLDTKAIFKGKFGELKDEVGEGRAGYTIELLGVKIDADGKQYQDVYKKSLSGHLMRILTNLKVDVDLVNKWRAARKDKVNNPNGRYLEEYEQFFVDVTDTEYPWGREFTFGPLQEFDENECVVLNGPAKQTADPTTARY